MKLQVMNNVKGLVIYDGPSMFTGNPIIVIATGFKRVKNKKTGKMIQIWILDRNMNPLEALESGDDENVCGSCFHRYSRSCYVNVSQGPYAVYKAWKEGVYVRATKKHLEMFRDRLVRIGAYGDPSSCPTSIWRSICGVAKGFTSYTHSWKICDPELKEFCMASCDTVDDALEARKRGWKSFRVRQSDNDALLSNEFICPAAKEAGKRLDCEHCLACHGGEWNGKQGTPCLARHGPSWKMKYFDIAIKAKQQKKKYRDITSRLFAV